MATTILRSLIAAGLLFPVAILAADADPKYFTNVRDAHATTGTNYFVVDADMWAHTRADIGDIRLYNGTKEIPYALREQGSAEYSEQHPVKVLNKGVTRGDITFLLDMSGVEEYDEITLETDRHDFNGVATVEGANTADTKEWTTVAVGPIFDFTKQRLGTNLTIAVPTSTYRFLRVSISRSSAFHATEITPEEIAGAKARNSYRRTAVWDDVGVSVLRGQNPHESVFEIEVPKGVPIDRIEFSVPDKRLKFRRGVTVEARSGGKKAGSGEGWEAVSSGEISRVPWVGGNIHEELEIATHDTRALHWRVTVHNGDDPPLPLQVAAQSVERRIYFDPQGSNIVRVYYGDEKVNAPVYDYAKFFRDATAQNAAEAKLGPAMDNPEFASRPDERPWTERNTWVLWTAMIVAIVGIGLVALRGLTRA